MKLKKLVSWKESYDKPRQQCVKKQRHHFVNKGDIVKASLVDQMVKNLPAMRETRVQSLGWEDPLKKEVATHSSILA